jgi:hypothetical protein
MFSALEASRETLRTIRLNFDVLMSLVDSSCCQRLWDLRFPRLETVALGVWHFDVRPSSPAAFTQFLVAHGETLVELDLAYSAADYFEYSEVFDGNLRPDSLPNLRRFEGHANAFLEMVDSRMECLRMLQSLKIGPGGDEQGRSFWEFHEIFDSLDRWQEEEGGVTAAVEDDESDDSEEEGGVAAAVEDDEIDDSEERRESILRSLTHLGFNWLEVSGIDADETLEVTERCAEHFGKTRYRSLVQEYRRPILK